MDLRRQDLNVGVCKEAWGVFSISMLQVEGPDAR